MALGVFITFRILDLPDLTVEGSVVLGMAVCAMITKAGHPYLALFASIIVGALAGLFTGILQTKLKINPILSGILTMTSLYSINFYVTGGLANVALTKERTIFTDLNSIIPNSKPLSYMVTALIITIIVSALLIIFFKTKPGLAIRATGDNEDMVRSSSINANFTKCAGLAIGNACVALSGALIGQQQMFFDSGFGIGIVVIGLAAVIIGEAVFGKRSVTIGIISTVIGSIIYYLIIALARRIDLFPSYGFKLATALIVIIALSFPAVKDWWELHKIRKRAKESLNNIKYN